MDGIVSDVLKFIGRIVSKPKNEPRRTAVVDNGRVISPSSSTDPKPRLTEDDVSIKLESADYLVQQNTKTHFTDRFDITQVSEKEKLVVRRGRPFLIKLTFNKPFDINSDDVRLLFTFGKNPIDSKGTRKDIKLSDKDFSKTWAAKIDAVEGKTLSIEIHTPPDCLVGIWEFSVDVITKSKDAALRYENKKPVYILFNPWCEDDQVYLSDAKLLEEYVLNETGRIYQGSEGKIIPKPWNFAQFQGNVLDCAMYVLNKSSLSPIARGDPIKVCRIITRLVNYQLDDGMMLGNWNGDYSDGTAPTSWNGSEKIIEQYYATKQPVKYAQCWVYAAVVNTLCRTLGIPARCISNFASAHDTDGSVTVDNHFDEAGLPLDDSDSIWNFHAWNDVWMARPDLPQGYGGWQVIDATPQETSEGFYQCGPASLEAVKQGQVSLPYDGRFVFAEVNADTARWVQKKDGTYIKVQTLTNTVGKFISTKSPVKKSGSSNSSVCSDSEWWDDVTLSYKYAEGSPEERAALLKAESLGIKRDKYLDLTQDENVKVTFNLIKIGEVSYGKDFNATLQIKNESDRDQVIGGCLTATTMYYTGVPFKLIKLAHTDAEMILKGDSIEKKLNVTFDEYYDKLTEGCHVRLSCQFHVKETNVFYTALDHFHLVKPGLAIKAEPNVKRGTKTKVDLTFVNPLDVTLTDCKVELEGSGLQKPLDLPMKNVKPKESFKTTVEIMPTKLGQRELIASFTSKEILDVCGSYEFNIAE